MPANASSYNYVTASRVEGNAPREHVLPMGGAFDDGGISMLYISCFISRTGRPPRAPRPTATASATAPPVSSSSKPAVASTSSVRPNSESGSRPMSLSNVAPQKRATSAEAGQSSRISTKRFDSQPKIDPFAPRSGSKTYGAYDVDMFMYRRFAADYNNGVLPFRISHGSCSNRLQWDRAPDSLDYFPLLITCLEGLIETQHPFIFCSRTAVKELLEADV